MEQGKNITSLDEVNAFFHSEKDGVSTVGEKEEVMHPPKEYLEEQMELQDRIISLDEVKALINQEADDLTGGHTHPEDRVNKDEMERPWGSHRC